MDKNSALLFLKNWGWVAKISAGGLSIVVYWAEDINNPGTWMEDGRISIDQTDQTVSCKAVSQYKTD